MSINNMLNMAQITDVVYTLWAIYNEFFHEAADSSMLLL
jgi:hypothetical protein